MATMSLIGDKVWIISVIINKTSNQWLQATLWRPGVNYPCLVKYKVTVINGSKHQCSCGCQYGIKKFCVIESYIVGTEQYLIWNYYCVQCAASISLRSS
jgi:hypothetical protein